MNSIYVDGFSIITGLVDAKLDLLTINPVIDENGNIVNEQREIAQRVVMALPLAKELVEKLGEAIATYESTFGTIMDLKEARAKADSQNGK